jgi:hypothetical protein
MRYFSVAVLCCAVALSGCAKKAGEKKIEKAIEKQTGGKADVDLSEQSLKVKTDNGEMRMTAGKSAKVPDKFPKDVLVYKKASIEAAVEVPQGFNLVMSTGDDKTKVIETYKKEMAAGGWTQKGSMDMGAQMMLMFEKDKRAAHIMVMTEEGKTRITVTAANK